MKRFLIAAILALLPTLAHGVACNLVSGSGIGCVQMVGANTLSSPASVAFTSNNTAGNLIVVVARVASGSTSTPTDSRNTYSTAVANVVITGTSTLSVYYAKNIGAGANTVSVVLSGGTARVIIFEFSGLDTTTPLDQTNSATVAGSNTPRSETVTTTGAQLLFSSTATDVSQNFSVGGSWTLEACQNTCAAGLLANEDQIVGTGATTSVAWGTFTGGPSQASIIASFKAATGGASAAPTQASPFVVQ